MELADGRIHGFLQVRRLAVDEAVDLRAYFLDVARDLKGLHRLVCLQHGQEVDDRITFLEVDDIRILAVREADGEFHALHQRVEQVAEAVAAGDKLQMVAGLRAIDAAAA